MEYEEILTDKQLKQLKALKIKYAAELIQHKKIKDEDVIKNVPKNNNKENNDNEENINDKEEEMEELDDEDLEEIEDDEGEELEDDNSNNTEEKEEENSNNEEEVLEGLELEEIEDEEEESIELADDELEQEEESEEKSFNKIQGFVNPDELKAYKRTRRERIDEIRNAQKEKFVLNKKRKRENTSKTNAEKLKYKIKQH